VGPSSMTRWSRVTGGLVVVVLVALVVFRLEHGRGRVPYSVMQPLNEGSGLARIRYTIRNPSNLACRITVYSEGQEITNLVVLPMDWARIDVPASTSRCSLLGTFERPEPLLHRLAQATGLARKRSSAFESTSLPFTIEVTNQPGDTTAPLLED
jgi:hypothetical protein